VTLRWQGGEASATLLTVGGESQVPAHVEGDTVVLAIGELDLYGVAMVASPSKRT
jgi:hypothetical protein